MNTTVNLEQLRTLGSFIPTTCGSTFQKDPPDAILFAAIQYIQNLEEEIQEKRNLISKLSVDIDNLEDHNAELCDDLDNVEKENEVLKDDLDHMRKLYDCSLEDFVQIRKELKAYKLVSELSEKYPRGIYDESEGVEYLRTVLNSNVDKS